MQLYCGIGTLIKMMEYQTNKDYIKQLEQSLTEQVQEKEYYINICKEYEEQLLENGLVVDNCECN